MLIQSAVNGSLTEVCRIRVENTQPHKLLDQLRPSRNEKSKKVGPLEHSHWSILVIPSGHDTFLLDCCCHDCLKAENELRVNHYQQRREGSLASTHNFVLDIVSFQVTVVSGQDASRTIELSLTCEPP